MTTGYWHVIVEDDHAAAVSSPTMRIVEALSKAVADGAGATAILDAVARDGPSRAPEFGLVAAEGTRVRVFVRGRVEGRVQLPDGTSQDVRASTHATSWAEFVLDDAERVVLATAGRALVDWAAPARTSADAGAPGPDAAPTTPEPDAARTTPEPDVARSATPADTASDPTTPEPGASRADGIALPSFARTRTGQEPGRSPDTGSPPDAEMDGLITGLPAHLRRRSGQRSGPPPSEPVPDDGSTIADTTTREPTGAPPPGAPPGPTLTGILCPAHHPNPPHLSRCRSCDTPLGDAAPVTLDRPVVAVLEFTSGQRIDIDGPKTIGRRPGSDGGVDLVALPDAGVRHDDAHLRIQLEGWTILAVDLGSTHGTTVVFPGHDPVRLRPHEPQTIVLGTTVELGADTGFRVSAPR